MMQNENKNQEKTWGEESKKKQNEKKKGMAREKQERRAGRRGYFLQNTA